MMDAYKPYPAYRPSGVAWLGDVPAHWEVRRLKFVGRLKSGAGFPDKEQGLADEELPFYKVSDMNLPGNELYMHSHNNSISYQIASELGAFVFPVQTVVFPKVGAALLTNKRRILSRPACIDNNTMGLIVVKGDVKFIFYHLAVVDFGFFANPGAVPSVNESQIKELAVSFPPFSEQRAIAEYLDRETAHIEALIARKRELIDLLQRQRRAVISHAVTKGLDPRAAMRPSGVAWLGDVPAHWDSNLAKRFFQIDLGKMLDTNKQRDEEGETKPYLRAANIYWEGVWLEDVKEMKFSKDQLKRYRLEKGDLLVTEGGVTVGRSAVWKGELEECYYQNSINRARCKGDLPVEFLYYWLYFLKLNGYIDIMAEKATFGHLTKEKLEIVPVLAPPAAEAREIVQFLDGELKYISEVVSQIEASIALLQRQRTALISAAVTGRIDVRGQDGYL